MDVKGELFVFDTQRILCWKLWLRHCLCGNRTGLPNGVHGFHIHQYGDESLSRDGKSRYGAHFVPTVKFHLYFVYLRLNKHPLVLFHIDCVCLFVLHVFQCQSLPPDSGFGETPPPQKDECSLMEVHGVPPDEIRQAGDMGNIIVRNGQVSLLFRGVSGLLRIPYFANIGNASGHHQATTSSFGSEKWICAKQDDPWRQRIFDFG